MKEKIYNIFTNFEDEILISIGYVMYEFEGTDEEKIKFLKKNLKTDKENMIVKGISKKYQVKDKFGNQKTGISHEIFNSMQYNGTIGVLTEYIFIETGAPRNPLTIFTCVVDGKIRIDKYENYRTEPIGPYIYSINEENPTYYLTTYMSEEGLDLNRLIKDDFIVAIQLMFNNQKYTSCLKLFMSAIDSIAFLEYGEIPNVNIFQKWLDKYCHLERLGVSSIELWEYRNSLMHMTNAYSRKVLANKVQGLDFYVSATDREELQSNFFTKYFNLNTFYYVITEGIGNWTQSYNKQRDKFESFLDRYDMILSDLRYAKIKFN